MLVVLLVLFVLLMLFVLCSCCSGCSRCARAGLVLLWLHVLIVLLVLLVLIVHVRTAMEEADPFIFHAANGSHVGAESVEEAPPMQLIGGSTSKSDAAIGMANDAGGSAGAFEGVRYPPWGACIKVWRRDKARWQRGDVCAGVSLL